MNLLHLILPIFMLTSSLTIFDFSPDSDLSNWRVVDDVVMGGRSSGTFFVDEKSGHAIYQGDVSLENNGGFSSVRYQFSKKEITKFEKVVLRIKGDGSRFQFRVKTNQYDRHSYIHYFQTTGEWETIEIPLAKMYPTFRGSKLNMPDYPAENLSEIAILIGNKKPQRFRLEIDKILLI